MNEIATYKILNFTKETQKWPIQNDSVDHLVYLDFSAWLFYKVS